MSYEVSLNVMQMGMFQGRLVRNINDDSQFVYNFYKKEKSPEEVFIFEDLEKALEFVSSKQETLERIKFQDKKGKFFYKMSWFVIYNTSTSKVEKCVYPAKVKME